MYMFRVYFNNGFNNEWYADNADEIKDRIDSKMPNSFGVMSVRGDVVHIKDSNDIDRIEKIKKICPQCKEEMSHHLEQLSVTTLPNDRVVKAEHLRVIKNWVWECPNGHKEYSN